MTREEAVTRLHWLKRELIKETDMNKPIDMAIKALSKPNYETDTEVRLAVTNRNKDKVVLWDAFGEVEYYKQTTSHGRLIDADALSKKLCKTTIFIKDGEVFQRMINDAPTISAEPKTGEWIKTVDGNGWNDWYVLKCPFCGATIEDKQYHSWEYNFCPNCGAKMKGE